MMFWLVVIGMVAVAIVDDCLIRRTVTQEEGSNQLPQVLADEMGIELRRGMLSGFDEGKERILRALQAHYYFGGTSQSTRDYGEPEAAKIEVEPKVA